MLAFFVNELLASGVAEIFVTACFFVISISSCSLRIESIREIKHMLTRIHCEVTYQGSNAIADERIE